MTTPSRHLFELKVLVEADDWHDVAALMASVDRALDPHRQARGGQRRWSVIAGVVPADCASELLWFVEAHDEPVATAAPARGAARMTA